MLSKVNEDTNFQPEKDKSERLSTLAHLSVDAHGQRAKNYFQLARNMVFIWDIINQIVTKLLPNVGALQGAETFG